MQHVSLTETECSICSFCCIWLSSPFSLFHSSSGMFGTGILSYFSFLRFLVTLNFTIFLLMFSFVMLPIIIAPHLSGNITYSQNDGERIYFFPRLEAHAEHKRLKSVSLQVIIALSIQVTSTEVSSTITSILQICSLAKWVFPRYQSHERVHCVVSSLTRCASSAGLSGADLSFLRLLQRGQNPLPPRHL